MHAFVYGCPGRAHNTPLLSPPSPSSLPNVAKDIMKVNTLKIRNQIPGELKETSRESSPEPTASEPLHLRGEAFAWLHY